MEQIGYQIVHAIAGRMRIKAFWLETDPEAAGKLHRQIESLSFITSVRLNPLAQSIVLTYKAKAISLEEAQAQLIDLIEQVNPVPLPVEVEPPITETTPLEAPPTPFSPAAPSSPKTSESVANTAIPSPWDEPDLETADMQLHSTASLAKRLNTTSQAITQRRTKPNFDGWTQVQDPDGVAWNYDEASQSFSPASSSVMPLTQETAPQPKADHPTEGIENDLEPINEILGADLSKEGVDEVQPPAETHVEIEETVGSVVGEVLQNEAGRSQGTVIEAEVEPAMSLSHPHESAPSQVEPSDKTVPPTPPKRRKSTKSSAKAQSPKKPRTQS
ncbi:HMA2 domain-containing protein [Phormidesmis sp. 146-35]